VGDKISSVLSIMFFAFCCVVPVLFGTIMYKKFTALDRRFIRYKYGALYNSLNLARGRSIILSPMHYFFRRMLLAIVIICQDSLFVQILAIVSSFVMATMILGFTKPFNDPFMQKMEYFNEIVLLLTLYCMMCFSDFVAQVET
jgi:hypothetical protein